MAEMLVDSTKLNACLDAEADAIRNKTGGSADIPFDYANDKGFADAIAAIPSGGGEVWELHVIEGIVLASSISPAILLTRYINKCAQWCYFPTSESPSTNSAVRGWCFDKDAGSYPPLNWLGGTGTAAGNTAINGVPMPTQYYINDQSVGTVRLRANVNNIPAGTYTLKFYGVAK